jgi:tetratricopeptide (TPR) repeat protein
MTKFRTALLASPLLLLSLLTAAALAAPQFGSVTEPLLDQAWDDPEVEDFGLDVPPPAGGQDEAGQDGAGKPPASTPNKEDRTDVLPDEAPIADPALRGQILKELYAQLRKAEDAAAAQPIIEAIEVTWHRSGSDTVDLLMSRIDAFVLQGDLDLATQVLDAVTDLAPENSEAWYQRAIVHSMQDDSEAALADLKHTLAIDPNHYKALRDLGAALAKAGDKKGALDAYRRALEVNPFFEQVRRAEKALSLDVDGRDI